MVINLIHHTLHHIPESHWNNRFKKLNIDCSVKYGYPENKNDPIVVVDQAMFDFDTSYENAFGLMIEPVEIQPDIYKNIDSVHEKFIKIFTHNKKLIEDNVKITDQLMQIFPFVPGESIESSNHFQFYAHGDCWLENITNFEKTKLLSIIASEKNIAPGHKLRHEIINKFRDKIDLYGKGYNPIDTKEPALAPYKFSLIIENSQEDYYFTEKLIDCLRCKTVPIYWGCPSINNFFNGNGILHINSINDFEKILPCINNKTYDNLKTYIDANYKLSFLYDTHFTQLEKHILRNLQ